MSDVIGMIGAVFYLLSYFLLQLKVISADSGYLYTMLNLVGALMVAYSLLCDFNLASMMIQGSWIIISLIGLYKIKKAKLSELPS